MSAYATSATITPETKHQPKLHRRCGLLLDRQ